MMNHCETVEYAETPMSDRGVQSSESASANRVSSPGAGLGGSAELDVRTGVKVFSEQFILSLRKFVVRYPVNPFIGGLSLCFTAISAGDIISLLARILAYPFNPWWALFAVPIGLWQFDILRAWFARAGREMQIFTRWTLFATSIVLPVVEIGIMALVSEAKVTNLAWLNTHFAYIWLALFAIGAQGLVWIFGGENEKP